MSIIGDNPEKALYTGPVHLYGVYRDYKKDILMLNNRRFLKSSNYQGTYSNYLQAKIFRNCQIIKLI